MLALGRSLPLSLSATNLNGLSGLVDAVSGGQFVSHDLRSLEIPNPEQIR
jgi:hypothetical protein